jgi:hypothetical protein
MLFGWFRKKDVRRSTLQPCNIPGRKTPVEEFTSGDVIAQVWANPCPGGFRFKVTFRRIARFPVEHFENSFDFGDLEDVEFAAARIILWMRQHSDKIALVEAPARRNSSTPNNRQRGRNQPKSRR